LTRNERGIRREEKALPRNGRFQNKLLLNKLRLPKSLDLNKGGEGETSKVVSERRP